MIISGIVMATRPERVATLCDAISEISWADVHYTEPDGRMVVTIEADDIEESMSRLGRLQELPHVMMAELAQYFVGDDESRRNMGSRS